MDLSPALESENINKDRCTRLEYRRMVPFCVQPNASKGLKLKKKHNCADL